MINQTPYDKSVDFWALGVLFYRMVAGKFPFDGAQDRIDPATDQPIVYTSILAGTALSGSISTVFTVLSWICVGIHSRRALPCPVCA